MNNQLKIHIDAITPLCRQFKVETLYAFGSVGTEKFNKKSDIDFLVRFSDNVPLLNFADNYFDFHQKLEHLLGRTVDLVIQKNIKNPYLARSIAGTKEKIYDREDEKVSL